MAPEDLLIEALEPYGVRPSARQCDQIRAYISLLSKWNRAISLTSVENELDILKFHFGESAFAISAAGSVFGRLADVGSGAGFPGLPLKIFCPDIDLILIEPNAKKAAFLSEVVRKLRLDRVQIVRARFEDTEQELADSLDFVTTRALGAYEDLLRWSSHALKSQGRLILWVGENDAREIANSPRWTWLPPVPIPGSTHRQILVGSK